MRLIDADALMPNAKYKGKYDILTAYDVAAAPTIDAVPVVRCPSCVWHDDDGYHECIMFGIRIPDDAEFFCKYGKRRGG